jgi:hypothetical protein
MATAPRAPQRLRHALDVTARAAAALVAGYAVAHAFAACMAVVLPLARPDRVVAGTLLSFIAWTLVALHAFGARSAWRVVAAGARVRRHDGRRARVSRRGPAAVSRRPSA